MEQILTFICHLKLNFIENKSDLKGPSCGEIVTVPLHATVKDLKQTAAAALRDTYCLSKFCVSTCKKVCFFFVYLDYVCHYMKMECEP